MLDEVMDGIISRRALLADDSGDAKHPRPVLDPWKGSGQTCYPPALADRYGITLAEEKLPEAVPAFALLTKRWDGSRLRVAEPGPLASA